MNVGFVGWRGLVGSVLMQRMKEVGDFDDCQCDRTFFTTSNVGGEGPENSVLKDANDVFLLRTCDIIITCQGSDWTEEMYPRLRESGWNGVWLDTSSFLRMEKDTIIVLDPLNKEQIVSGLKKGIRTFAGGNCTVSLMLMACHGLFKNNLVEWINSMTYQAASGAGSEHIRELLKQIEKIGYVSALAENISQSILEVDQNVSRFLNSPNFPCENFKVPLACSLIPWIDSYYLNGQTREEWKSFAEGNKILGLTTQERIPMNGICVRVGVMRCHSQALLIKLKRHVPLQRLEQIISRANDWVKVIPNNHGVTIHKLTPAAVSGKLTIAVGRIHQPPLMGDEYIQIFTVGDQLLWGAAEPIRRAFRIIWQEIYS